MAPQRKTEILVPLLRQYLGTTFRRILAVGCGTGLEAVRLSEAFKTEVIGIDTNPSSFDPQAISRVELRQGDATRLDFPDRYFDLVYCFHTLEHIPEYARALSEMARVLTDGGGGFIGTPNRSRWIGYIGSETASWQDKIIWNLEDWHYRLRGRFRNEYGAHAGFNSSEVRMELEKVFPETEEITKAYYLAQYPKGAGLIKALDSLGVGKLLFPAIYFIGKK